MITSHMTSYKLNAKMAITQGKSPFIFRNLIAYLVKCQTQESRRDYIFPLDTPLI